MNVVLQEQCGHKPLIENASCGTWTFCCPGGAPKLAAIIFIGQFLQRIATMEPELLITLLAVALSLGRAPL
jgi:hypothetical protein